MGPCWVSTSSQSYPLCASCSATVGLWALRKSPILGLPARSCFLNSDPLMAASGMGILLGLNCVVYRMLGRWAAATMLIFRIAVTRRQEPFRLHGQSALLMKNRELLAAVSCCHLWNRAPIVL